MPAPSLVPTYPHSNPLNWRLNHAMLGLAWSRAFVLGAVDDRLDSHVKRSLLRELVLLDQNDFSFLQYAKDHGVKSESIRQWLLSAPTPEYARLSKEQFGNLPSNSTNRLTLSTFWKNQIHQRTLGIPIRTTLLMSTVAVGIAVANPIAILPSYPLLAAPIYAAAGFVSARLGSAVKGLLKGKRAQDELLPQLEFIDPSVAPDAPASSQVMAGLALLKPRERLLLSHLDAGDLRHFLGGDDATKRDILAKNPPPTWNWLKFLNLASTPWLQALNNLFHGKKLTSAQIIQNLHNRRSLEHEVDNFQMPVLPIKSLAARSP